MTQTPYFHKHPLILAHLACWTIYILADWAGHVTSGYFILMPSLICGLSACLLTGFTAALYHKIAGVAQKAGVISAVLALYFSAILWDKTLIVMHTEGEITHGQALQNVMNHSLSDWLRPNYQPLIIFIAWALFLTAATWYLAWQDQSSELSQAQLKTRQAQLQTLRYQLNPHFLFNVLNSVDVSLMSDDKETAHHMLQNLSQFLRSSLEQGEQDKIRLDQEFQILNHYLAIENVRFSDSLDLQITLDPGCEDAMVPPMLLQPLMENAVKYAWSQTSMGHTTLKAQTRENRLILSIENSKAQDVQIQSGTGTGLRNTAERLQLVYGDDATLETRDQSHQFAIQIILPLERAATNEAPR